MQYLKLEFYKLKHRHVFLTVAAIILIQTLWCLLATDQYLGRGNMTAFPWESLLMTFSSTQVIFFPIAAAVLSSRLCDIEHLGNTFKWLETTTETRDRLYFAKFLASNLLLTAVLLMTYVFLLVYGLLIHPFGTPLPLGTFLINFWGTVFITALLVTLTQWLALYFKNQLVVMVSGIVLGFLGIMGSLFPAGVRYLIPSCYYLDLSPAAFDTISGNGIILVPISILPFVLSLVLSIILYLTGRYFICKQEQY